MMDFLKPDPKIRRLVGLFRGKDGSVEQVRVGLLNDRNIHDVLFALCRDQKMRDLVSIKQCTEEEWELYDRASILFAVAS